jgi:hypothetical protein
LIQRKFPLLICRNAFTRPGMDNGSMSFEPKLNSVGQRRPSLGMVACLLIVLAGVIAVVGILIAYGLVGTF